METVAVKSVVNKLGIILFDVYVSFNNVMFLIIIWEKSNKNILLKITWLNEVHILI